MRDDSRTPDLVGAPVPAAPLPAAGALLFLLAVGIGAAAPRDAYAYLDAASGSIMLQAAFAGIFAAVLTLKVYWQRFRTMFTRSAPAPKPTPEPTPPVPQSLPPVPGDAG